MSDELEAAGLAIEGGLLARATEPKTGPSAGPTEHIACQNCGTIVSDAYCGNCGQAAHVHRSIGAIWDDILHGVFHFEGKFWRTLPLLAWRPGELTRRYIAGERAKFVSPMALFLFSVFLMFAVFSFGITPFADSGSASDTIDGGYAAGVAKESEDALKKLKTAEASLANPQLTEADRKKLQVQIIELKQERNVLSLMQGKDQPHPEVPFDADGSEPVIKVNGLNGASAFENTWLGKTIKSGISKANKNPSLLFYKLKSNGYKFAWLLIPLSVPFMWLVTIGKRGYHFYDHAVFVTYSISFMSLLFIVLALLSAVGQEAAFGFGLLLIPPFHMYRQLRQAYQLSRPMALIRLVLALFAVLIVMALFMLILLALGVLG